MATIQITYDGKCVGGPWNGQRVVSDETSVIREHQWLKGGAYRFTGGEWRWHPTAANEQQARTP
jgi:hypothetical protein